MTDRKVQSRNFTKTYKKFLTEFDKYKRVCGELERKDWLQMPLELTNLTDDISVNLITRCFRFNDFLKQTHRNQFKSILHMNECKNCYLDNNDNVIMMYMNILLNVPVKKTKKKRIVLIPKPEVNVDSDTELSDVEVFDIPPKARKIKLRRYKATTDDMYVDSS